MPYPYKTIREWILEEEKLGNVLRIETPIKCGDYNNIVDISNDIPGKIPETEVRAVVRYLHTLPGKPIGIIENPVDNRPDIPVVVNTWATRERTLRGMGLKSKDELGKKFKSILEGRIKPVKVSNGEAPCKEVIIPEERLDLRKDIPRVWVEFNQLLWNGCNGTWVTYDPDTGTHGMAKTRLGLFEWKNANPDTPYPEERVKQYGFATVAFPGPGQGNAARRYHENYKAKNQPMPCAFVFGVPTDVHMVAANKSSLRWPETGDEYEILGGFRGESIEIVESETIPGLMVPARAEWVVEGEFLLEADVTPLYGEDQFIGHVVGEYPWPVFKVKCITHQKQPWWTATTFSSSGLSGHEGPHTGLVYTYAETEAISYLRGLGFKVRDIVKTGGASVTVIQTEVDGADKPSPDYGKEVAKALAERDRMSIYIIVVGPDIDPYDRTDVLWAIGLRAWPVTDSILTTKGSLHTTAKDVTPGGKAGKLAFLQGLAHQEQMLIDALIKFPERFSEWAPRSDPPQWERMAIERIRERIG